MDQDGFPLKEGVPKPLAHLRLGHSPVKAGGHDDLDLRLGISRSDLVQEKGQGNGAGHGPGMVAGDHQHPLFIRRQFPEPGAFDGLPKGFRHDLPLLFLRPLLLMPGFHRSQHPSGVQIRLHNAFIVWNGNPHELCSSFFLRAPLGPSMILWYHIPCQMEAWLFPFVPERVP